MRVSTGIGTTALQQRTQLSKGADSARADLTGAESIQEIHGNFLRLSLRQMVKSCCGEKSIGGCCIFLRFRTSDHFGIRRAASLQQVDLCLPDSLHILESHAAYNTAVTRQWADHGTIVMAEGAS